MKLISARVRTFRSIVDSGDVDIEERLTVLVGKNEQGKTTFLKALTSFEKSYRYGPNDLPNHLRATLAERSKADEIPIVKLTFLPEPADRQLLSELVPDFDAIESFIITKFYNSRYAYFVRRGDVEVQLQLATPNIRPQVDAIKAQVELLRPKLIAHQQRLPDFGQHAAQTTAHISTFINANFSDSAHLDNLVQTFATGLAAVPGQDTAVQQDVDPVVKEIKVKVEEIKLILTKDQLSVFSRLLPKFVLHSSNLDRIPNDVNLTDFIREPQTKSSAMANLCLAAGLPMQKLQELASSPDTYLKQIHEDEYKGRISGGLNQYWTQAIYEVHLRFDSDKLSVFISDSNYGRRIPPSDRSDGFQWYLSFYSTVWSTVGSSTPTVLLLDNPGLELHADGQRDIKQFLELKLPAATQIIYVTHSPAMIDPFHLEQVRQVELLSNDRGTVVSPLKTKPGVDFDLMEPVRAAVGLSLISSLLFNKVNVLVEGAADKPILEAAIELSYKDEIGNFLINGSIAESKDAVLAKFYKQAKVPFVVYLDADAAGKRLEGVLLKNGIPADRIIKLGKVVPADHLAGTEFELEDIFSAQFYHDAVSGTYPKHPVDIPPANKEKRTKKYMAAYKEKYPFEFSKRAVADTAKQLLLDGSGDAETLGNLKLLSKALYDALQKQVAK
jgi:predicted ATPase